MAGKTVLCYAAKEWLPQERLRNHCVAALGPPAQPISGCPVSAEGAKEWPPQSDWAANKWPHRGPHLSYNLRTVQKPRHRGYGEWGDNQLVVNTVGPPSPNGDRITVACSPRVGGGGV